MYAEHRFPVPPLALPDSRNLPSLERLSQYEAVRLFIERARSVKPDFSVTNESAPFVAEICARLDGLPLAIELAAARISILSPQAILIRLQSRLKLLTGGARDLPARQQTLRGAFEWSYDLLDAGEQQLFRRLAAFVGGFTFEAAEAVCNANTDLDIDILDGVMSLSGESLLRELQEDDAEARFGMLETTREFALEKLSESGELEDIRKLHALYFLQFLESASDNVYALQPEALMMVSRDYDDAKVAVDWLFESDDLETIARLAVVLYGFWNAGGSFAAGLAKVERSLASLEARRDSLPNYDEIRGRLLFLAGAMGFLQGNFSMTRSRLVEAIDLMRAHGEMEGLANVLHIAGMSAQFQNEYEAARSQLEESVRIFRQAGPKGGLAVALFSLGDVELAMRDDDKAKATYEESLTLYRQLGDPIGRTFPLTSLGRLAWLHGDYASARSLVEEALETRRQVSMSMLAGGANWVLAISLASLSDVARCEDSFEEACTLATEAMVRFRELGDQAGVAWATYALAYASYYSADYEKSERLFADSLKLRNEQGSIEGAALCLAGFASLAARKADLTRAARLYGATEALIESVGVRLSPYDRADYDKHRAGVLSKMGEDKFTAEWRRGQTMSLEDAVSYGLDPGVGSRTS